MGSVNELIEEGKSKAREGWEHVDLTGFTYRAGSLGYVTGGIAGGTLSLHAGVEAGKYVNELYGADAGTATAATVFVGGTVYGGYRLATLFSAAERYLTEEHGEINFSDIKERILEE